MIHLRQPQFIGALKKPTSDPYSGVMTYTRQGLGTTTLVNPTGSINLQFGTNPVIDVHCHDCPNITTLLLRNSPVLVTVDFKNCPALKDWTLENCTALTTLDLSFMKTGGVVNVNSLPALTSVNFSNLETCTRLAVGTNNALTTLSFPKLTVSTQIFFVYDSPLLATLNVPLLTSVSELILRNNDSMVVYNFPALTTVPTIFDVKDCAVLTTALFPALSTCATTMQMQTNPLLTTINFNTLQSFGALNLSDCTALTTLNLPAKTGTLTNVTLTNSTVFTSVTFNNRPLVNGIQFIASGCALNQATVDLVLAAGIAGGLFSGTINLSGGTSAAPSATGETNKATLLAAGVTVLTNGDPFSGKLVYTRQGLGDTTVANPTGPYDLTFGSNLVTAIHCHNCPNINGLTCVNSDLLTVVDLVNVPSLDEINFDNSDGLVTLGLSQLNNPFIGNLTITGCNLLQTINLNGVTDSLDLNIHSNPALVTINAPTLQSCRILNFGLTGVVNVEFPALVTCMDFISYNQCPSLETVSFPLLATVATSFGGLTNDLLQVIYCPLLASCQIFYGNTLPSLASVALDSLQVCSGQLLLYDNPALPVVSMPSLVSCPQMGVFSNSSMTVLDIFSGSQTLEDGMTVEASDSALDQNSVDQVLQYGVNTPMTYGTLNLQGGTSSYPSITGEANRSLLQSAGVVVNTN